MKKTNRLLLITTLLITLFVVPVAAEEYAGMQTVLNAVTDAALSCDTDLIDGAPTADVSCYAIRALLRDQYQVGTIGPENRLNTAELKELYSHLFACGTFAFPAELNIPGLETDRELLVFHLDNITGCAGAVPMLIEPAGNDLRVVCELYISHDAFYNPDTDDASLADWIGTGEFFLEITDASPYGYRLLSFRRMMDEAEENPLAIFADDHLGLGFAYPSELEPYLAIEDATVSASLPDGGLSVTARVIDSNGFGLDSYGDMLTSKYPNGLLSLYADAGYLTLAFETDGYTCYRVVSITDEAIYEVELMFTTQLLERYGMFTEYLENSFTIFEYAVG